ncbi:MAG: TRAP transporter TatT component family protein [Pseudomonadales bacterium]
MAEHVPRWLLTLLLAWLAAGLSGCASLVGSVAGGMAEDLGGAILDNPDVAMVRDGAPAYLILIDGLLAQSPTNAGLLGQAAQLNSAYAAGFVEDPARNRALNAKALGLAERALCAGLRSGCGVRARKFQEYEAWLAARDADDVPLLYRFGATWAGWIQANSDDFAAIAELARVKALMNRVIELDEGYDYAGAHLYMGVFETLFPPAMGGRPEEGRRHFERALALSEGRYLMTKVLYAEQYGRLMFDRPLHDRLLNEVVAADPQLPGLTLINVVAQRRATELLESADEYF